MKLGRVFMTLLSTHDHELGYKNHFLLVNLSDFALNTSLVLGSNQSSKLEESSLELIHY